MQLVLKNIGKVSYANIDVNGITVIAGENNTGKSTIAKALFVLCNAFYDKTRRIYAERLKSIEKNLRVIKLGRSEFEYLFPSANDGLREIAKSILDDSEKLKNSHQDLRKKITGWLDGVTDVSVERPLFFDDIFFNSILERICSVLSLSSEEIFGGILEQAIRAEFSEEAHCLFTDKLSEIMISESSEEKVIVGIDSNNDVHADNFFFQMENAVYIDNVVGFSESILPHQLMLMRELQKSPISDNVVDELIAKQKLDLVFSKLISVCRGNLIRIESNNKMKPDKWFYSLEDFNKPLPIDNLSAGIRMFAVLKFLIKNGAIHENGILILDEPETHLHPAWQLVMAEVIVLLCKYLNVKILLNTHSPYFLDALEVYSARYSIADKCKYYLSHNVGNLSEVEDVTGSIDKIYKKLLVPVQDLYDLRSENQ